MFEKYLGRRQPAAYSDPVTRKGCELWLQRVIAFYGEDGGVDVEIIDAQLPLTEETAEYVYSEFTPLDIGYVRGSRPLLEKIIAENNPSLMEKALSLIHI